MLLVMTDILSKESEDELSLEVLEIKMFPLKDLRDEAR